MPEQARSDIRQSLESCEEEFKLPSGTLVDIYNAEMRVVFMGKRRNLLKELREIVYHVAETVGGAGNDNSKA